MGALALVVLAAALLAAGCGDEATPAVSSSGTPASSLPPGAAPSAAPGGDGMAGAASLPVVYLLGGSTARECIESDEAFAAAIGAAGGPQVRVVNLGATNQSYTADRRLVRGMPEGALVLVGVSLGRYTTPPPRALAAKPLDAEARAALAGEAEPRHRYSAKRIQTDERKGELLDTWLAERYELYRRNYEANHGELERLVRACRDRGLRVALLELPLNLEFVGDRLDVPRATYLEDCRRLAARSGAAFLSFVEQAGLANTDFYDLMHLVEPGRAKWQARLAGEVAAILADGR